MNIKKIIREEIDDLDWIKRSEGEQINSGEHVYEIILEYFMDKHILEYKGWQYFMDTSGSIEWYSPSNNDKIYYATPYWNNTNFLPIDYTNSDGDYESVSTLEIPKFQIVDEVIYWLDNIYPEITYQELVNHELNN